MVALVNLISLPHKQATLIIDKPTLSRIHSMRGLLAVAVLSLLLSGCALSPQAITLTPQLQPGTYQARGQSISVSIQDQRANPVLGTRGGIYARTSNITLRNDVSQTLANSLGQALSRMGFQVQDYSSANVHMRVILDRLTYQASVKGVIQTVDLSNSIKVVIEQGSFTYTGQFETEKHHEFARIPDEQTNTRIINELFADTLNRALSDPKVRQALQR
ncbi:hypothetical protein C4K68_10385 [Pokkaliibacter plantistimulans]|uniref:Lipoprotein n=2 Tax=Pseudomonadota TaxID=1224 RepID=A0A2S5KR89_9PROT|nr:hypothetical protein C4K68_10385 [Pokkaliibacter plantistimulans]